MQFARYSVKTLSDRRHRKGRDVRATHDKRSTRDLFIASAANGQVILLRKGHECLWAEGVPAEKTEPVLNWLRAL